MRKPISIFAPTIATLVLLLAAGCDKENKTIKIATQSPLSGAMSVIGSDIKSGTQLGIEQLSGPLTAMGFKVELAPFDDQGNLYVLDGAELTPDRTVVGNLLVHHGQLVCHRRIRRCLGVHRLAPLHHSLFIPVVVVHEGI